MEILIAQHLVTFIHSCAVDLLLLDNGDYFRFGPFLLLRNENVIMIDVRSVMQRQVMSVIKDD